MVDTVKSAVRRAHTIKSRQPRLTQNIGNSSGESDFFALLSGPAKYSWEMPPPTVTRGNARRYDEWMNEIYKQEPHLSGVIASVTMINQDRGWHITGGKNLVRQSAHLLYTAEGNYRDWIAKMSEAYYTTKMGAVVEIGRETSDITSPIAGFYNVDPTRLELSGNPSRPLWYYPIKGKRQEWRRQDAFRFTSQPSILEKNYNLGFPAVERCLGLMQIMMAIYMHDKEMLGSAPPRGFVLLQGMTDNQFKNALDRRKRERADEGVRYMNDIVVLASPTATIDMKMVALSELPRDFSLSEWVQLLVQGYALCMGFDPNEFYSVRSGAALGIAQQSSIQSEKATAKGEMEFALALQSRLREYLPAAVNFEWDERTYANEQTYYNTQKLIIETYLPLYVSAAVNGTPAITIDEFRSLLAMHNVIPKDFIGEDVAENTDLGIVRAKARDHYAIRSYAEMCPHEPIIRVHHNFHEQVLWSSGEEMLRRHLYPVAKVEDAAIIKFNAALSRVKELVG